MTITKKIVMGVHDKITTAEIDNLAAETVAAMTLYHPDYALLAARIAVSNLHKETALSFSSTMRRLFTYVNPKTNKNAPLIAKDVYGIFSRKCITVR